MYYTAIGVAVFSVLLPLIYYAYLEYKIKNFKEDDVISGMNLSEYLLADKGEDDVSGQSGQKMFSLIVSVLNQKHNVTRILESELTNSTLVGIGSSARVVKATWHGTVVAVKIINNIKIKPEENNAAVGQFTKEITMWSRLKHPCIVEFFGVTPKMSIVMEYMEHGSLKALMHHKHLDDETRLNITIHVAIALNFLHSNNIIHRDLNPNNVMITGPLDKLQAKLADFGLSTFKQEELKKTLTVGTPVVCFSNTLFFYTFFICFALSFVCFFMFTVCCS